MNREREVVEIALYNAQFVNEIRNRRAKDITDWRYLKFVYAAQMYGAGKTRIGQEFVEKTSMLEEKFVHYCPQHLRGQLPELLPVVKEFSSAQTVRYDLNVRESFSAFARKCLGDSYDSKEDEIGNFSKFLLKQCASAASPIFFHFDEVGSLDANSLRRLRNSCWDCLVCLDNQQLLQTCFPFFFFSGRDAAYDELGSSGPPIGSHWLILEPLERIHVRKVLNEATFDGSKSFQFFNNLTENQLNDLIDSVIEWTAGAPRPLLYTFHMLEVLHDVHGELYKTRDGLKEIFNVLVNIINDEDVLKANLGAVSRRGGVELDGTERRAYEYLAFRSWLDNSINHDFTLPPTLGSTKFSKFLRAFNVFAKVENNCMKFVVPRFVSSLLQKNAQEITFRSIVGFGVKPEDAFETSFSALCLMYQYFQENSPKPVLFPWLIPEHENCNRAISLQPWKKNGPKLNDKGRLTIADVEEIVKCKGKYTRHQLKLDYFEHFCDLLKIGAMVKFAPMSQSCDTIVKVAENYVIEFQFKSGKTEIPTSVINKETAKSVVYHSSKYKSVFVMLCASGIVHDHPIKEHPNIKLYVPTIEQLKFFYGEKLLSVFQKSPGDD